MTKPTDQKPKSKPGPKPGSGAIPPERKKLEERAERFGRTAQALADSSPDVSSAFLRLAEETRDRVRSRRIRADKPSPEHRAELGGSFVPVTGGAAQQTKSAALCLAIAFVERWLESGSANYLKAVAEEHSAQARRVWGNDSPLDFDLAVRKAHKRQLDRAAKKAQGLKRENARFASLSLWIVRWATGVSDSTIAKLVADPSPELAHARMIARHRFSSP